MKSCGWKRYIVSNVEHQFNPRTDMKKSDGISGVLKQTIFDNTNSQCRKIQLKIPDGSGEQTHKNIVIYIVWYPDSVYPNINAMLRVIITWFCFVVPFARKDCQCSDNVNVFLLLTAHAAEMPNSGEILKSENLLSAYTYTCETNNEMFILRQDVWFKAIIHESFHTFGLDFSDKSFYAKKAKVRELFPGIADSVQIRLYESYTDIWATICYTMINILCFHSSHRHKTHRKPPSSGGANALTSPGFRNEKGGRSLTRSYNTHSHMNLITKALHKQCCFAVFQSAKMLQYQGIDITKFMSQDKSYEEGELMLFSYHVLRPMYMLDLNAFIEWTAQNNYADDYLRFDERKIGSFVGLLSQNKSKFTIHPWKYSGEILNKLNADTYLKKTAALTHNMVV